MQERSLSLQKRSDLSQRTDPRAPEDSALLQQTPGDDYGRKALFRVRKAVEGNGIDPESVILGAIEGDTYAFDAHVYFRFVPKTREEILPAGRPPGATFQTLATRADLDREIAVYMHKIIEDPASGAQAASLILARPDRGFGFTQEEIPTNFSPKNFLLKETCPDCKGAAKSACAKCQGSGKTACPKCKTTKMAICPVCYGRKTTADKKSKCIKCHGTGHIPCTPCRQTGYIACTTCGGTGKSTCKTCAGQGWTGRKITIDMSVLADYDYNRAVLPAELASMVEKLGPKTIAQGYARMEPGPIGRSEDRATFVIPCRLTFPFAKVGIVLPEKNFTCTVLGHNERVMGLPAFLDQIIEPGVKDLRKAAANGNVALPYIRKACQLRTVRAAILAAAKGSPGHAIEVLRREHGSTLSPAMMKNLIALSNRALNRVATIPALIGTAIGLMAATGFYAIAFSHSGRSLISEHLSGTLATNFVDLLLFLCGGLLTMAGTGAGIRHAFGSILGSAGMTAQNGVMLRRRWATMLGWGLSLVSFLGIAAIALHGNAEAPQWFTLLAHIAG